MTRPSPDERPTTVLPQPTVEQPTVSTGPATRRARVWRHIPARIGRARTSTLVIACLFVLLMGLNAALPRGESGTVPVTTSDGRTIDVPRSLVPSAPATTPSPTAPVTTAPPAAPTPATTTRPSATTSAPEEEEQQRTTAPATTAERSEPAPRSTVAPSTSSAPASRAPTSSRAPAATAEPTTTDAPASSAPTS